MGWKTLGDYLVRARREGGFASRRAFAEHVGVSIRTLDNLERGARTAYKVDTIAAVEIALHWEPGSVDRVVRGGRPIPQRNPDLEELVRIWWELPDPARRMLLRLAREAHR